jgi:hypothetical protein
LQLHNYSHVAQVDSFFNEGSLPSTTVAHFFCIRYRFPIRVKSVAFEQMGIRVHNCPVHVARANAGVSTKCEVVDIQFLPLFGLVRLKEVNQRLTQSHFSVQSSPLQPLPFVETQSPRSPDRFRPSQITISPKETEKAVVNDDCTRPNLVNRFSSHSKTAGRFSPVRTDSWV